MVDAYINQSAIDEYYKNDIIPSSANVTTFVSRTIPNTTYYPQTGQVVQAFDVYGIAATNPVDLLAQKVNNFARAFNNLPVEINGTQSSGQTIISGDTIAFKQKGYLQEKGFFGDQSISNEFNAFNQAINIGMSFLGIASSIMNISNALAGFGVSFSSFGNSSRYYYSTTTTTTTFNVVSTANTALPRTADNYYLLPAEVTLLKTRVAQYASTGIVPAEMIEKFLYIVCCIDNVQDLGHIGAVVGITEFSDSNYVRQPLSILNLSTLSRISYLANGIAAVDNQYNQFYSARLAEDHTQSITYTLTKTAEQVNYAAKNGTSLNLSSSQFPQIATAQSLIGTIQSSLSAVSNLLSMFSNFATNISTLGSQIAGIFGGGGGVSDLLSSTSTLIDNIITKLRQFGISTLSGTIDSLYGLVRNVRSVMNFASQIQALATVTISPGKLIDVINQIQKLIRMVQNLLSAVSGILSAINALASSLSNIGLAAAKAKNSFGGFAMSAILAELTLGQRLPSMVLYNNPILQAPSFIGQAFFGEAANAQYAIEQLFCRKIGAFPAPQNAMGAAVFGMQNFGSYGGSTSLRNMVSRTLLDITTAPAAGTTLGDLVDESVTNVANLLNIKTDSIIEARRSDNAIPYLIAMTAVIAGDEVSPIETSNHSEAWKIASSVGNDLQRNNPDFFTTISATL
jgi:hypothetical protein